MVLLYWSGFLQVVANDREMVNRRYIDNYGEGYTPKVCAEEAEVNMAERGRRSNRWNKGSSHSEDINSHERGQYVLR